MKTCTVDGCARKHLARGYCGTHYNRTHYTAEQRHRKHQATCIVCGKQWESARPDGKLCSDACRAIDYTERRQPTFCRVPWRTCPDCGIEWFRFGSQAKRCDGCVESEREHQRTARVLRLTEVERQMQPRPCGDCGAVYTPGTTVQRYCGQRCARRVAKRERTAREHDAQGSFTWTQVIALFLLFDRKCAYCARAIDGQPDPDHVIPLSRGGHNYIGNILPACRDCNCDKRDVMLHEWNADRLRRGLPPRITTWSAGDRRYAHLTAQDRRDAA